jgi:hypothetical protein
MICLVALAAVQAASDSGIAGKSPVFDLCKNFLGGRWEGVVGKNVKVEFKFHMEDGGNKFVGIGTIAAGSKSPLSVHTSFGWDPDAKQVYYLDQHGYDTVYFGHVTRENNDFVVDFKALCGDTGHYLTRQTMSKDSYEAVISYEKDGKWVSLGEHIKMHRVKGS